MAKIHISYAPLFKLLKQRNIPQKELWKAANISGSSRQKLRKNECITTNVIIRICEVLNCDIQDVLRLVKN